jgi:hypothetical protein
MLRSGPGRATDPRGDLPLPEGLFQLLPSLQYSLHPDDVQTGSVYVQQEAKEDELLFFIKAQRIASKFDIDPDDLEKGKILYTNIIPSTTIPTKDLILYSHWIYKTPKYFKLLESAD